MIVVFKKLTHIHKTHVKNETMATIQYVRRLPCDILNHPGADFGVCWDILEMVGKQVEKIRKNIEFIKSNYKEILNHQFIWAAFKPTKRSLVFRWIAINVETAWRDRNRTRHKQLTFDEFRSEKQLWGNKYKLKSCNKKFWRDYNKAQKDQYLNAPKYITNGKPWGGITH